MKESITRTRNADGTYHVEGTRDNGTIECECGAIIPMTEDVVEYEVYTGRVTDWGPAQGVCGVCSLLYVDAYWLGRVQVFSLEGGRR